MTKVSEVSSGSIDEASSKNYIKAFSKRMLKTQMFIGTFQEKRFVEPVKSYRDVVKIDSEEKTFIENLLAVKKKIKEEFSKYSSLTSSWIGITTPETIGAPVGYHLWVLLPVQVFGTYWFKVKTVEVIDNEVRLKLEVVRVVRSERSVSDTSETEENQSFEVQSFSNRIGDIFKNIYKNVKINLLYFCKSYITLSNIKDSVIFLTLLISAIIAGGVNIIKYLMEYILKLLHEFSGFVKVCSPIIITCINLIGKTIYGFYALIVALFHGKPVHQPPVYNSYYSADPNHMLEFRNYQERYNKYRDRRSIPYKSSVTITPLDD